MHYLNTGDFGTNNPFAGAIAYHPTLLQPIPGFMGQINVPSLWLTGVADFRNGPKPMIKVGALSIDGVVGWRRGMALW
jgi:hypothetical protein